MTILSNVTRLQKKAKLIVFEGSQVTPKHWPCNLL